MDEERRIVVRGLQNLWNPLGYVPDVDPQKVADLPCYGFRATDCSLSPCLERVSHEEHSVFRLREKCASLQNVIKGFRQTVENQCNLRDENERLKNNIHILEKKLKAHEQEYESQINKLVTEIRNREEIHKMELTKVYCDMNRKFEQKEEEHKEQIGKKELEVLELTRQLRTQDKEKQNEIIKLQIDFNAKLARVQNKATKSFPDTTALPQNIYRRKLQHLQEEKNKEIEILRNTIRDLEQRLSRSPDFHLKRSRF
ncbi:PREDICTED: coiled-coil domain-containing protein 152 [Gavialis gangeticus]|uniref:coiled-coil domain-containing protein 152 n=1 Tax=Gavialis gangeticus TaxID=94835 RepID=UPI00092EAA3B|nr:PREDICTED: coiled-coil domain-containing protein 152 [Gavialis gangeticus]